MNGGLTDDLIPEVTDVTITRNSETSDMATIKASVAPIEGNYFVQWDVRDVNRSKVAGDNLNDEEKICKYALYVTLV